VFVVDDADRMTGATPEALLKTLEEPPSRTVIVLVMTRITALPATVLSRCQIVRFRPRMPAGARALLPDGADERYVPGLRALAEAEQGGADAILRAGEAVGRNRQAAEALVEACWLRYRDLLCRDAGGDPRLDVLPADVARSARAAVAGAPRLDHLLRGLVACREAWQALQGNVSPRVTVEVLLSRLAAPAGVAA
jgi:DNA polymerase III gamma/tau subunit